MRLFLPILVIIMLIITVQHAFGMNYEFAYDEYKPGGSLRQYHEMKLLNFTVISVEKFFISKWVDEPGDYSDILKIKFNVTNNGLENFSVYKNMFQIDVLNPSKFDARQPNKISLVDNYYPHYIEDFKLRFQDILLPPELSECVLLNHTLRINQTKTLSVCFDVRQKWTNQPMDFSGPRKYYLVMMDNKFASSCPNCKSILLNDYYKNPLIESKLAPQIQIDNGKETKKIFCKDGFILLHKNSKHFACVKPSTAKILEYRGWVNNP